MSDNEVRIFGYSDDLIKIEGAIYDEFNPTYDDGGPALVACSNGVLLRITYGTDGVWRIVPLSGADRVTIWQCSADDAEGGYSDIATITDPLEWVAMANTWDVSVDAAMIDLPSEPAIGTLMKSSEDRVWLKSSEDRVWCRFEAGWRCWRTPPVEGWGEYLYNWDYIRAHKKGIHLMTDNEVKATGIPVDNLPEQYQHLRTEAEEEKFVSETSDEEISDLRRKCSDLIDKLANLRDALPDLPARGEVVVRRDDLKRALRAAEKTWEIQGNDPELNGPQRRLTQAVEANKSGLLGGEDEPDVVSIHPTTARN